MDNMFEKSQLSDNMDIILEETDQNYDETNNNPERKGFIIKAISLENVEPPRKIVINIELNGKSMGRSEGIFVQEKEISINWEIFFETPVITEGLLDELITHPLVFSVLQESVLPLAEEPPEPKKYSKDKKDKGKGSKSPSEKDKSIKEHSISNVSRKTSKSKESKTSTATVEPLPVLGVGNLDMIPLLHGQENIENYLILNPTMEQKGSEIIAWENLPKLKVSVCTTKELVNDISIPNILSFTLESLHNVQPDCNEGIEVATILPNNQVIKFKKGTLVVDDTVWVSKRKKWFGLRDLPGQGAHSEYKLAENSLNLYNTLECEVTDRFLTEKPRIYWNQLHRSFLNVDSEDIFKDKILEFNCWPVEIIIPRSLSKNEGKKKNEKTIESSINHYMAFLDLSRLIYPGEKTIRLTSQLYTYMQETMKNRFGSINVLFDETIPPPALEALDTKGKTAPNKKENTKSVSTKSKKSSLKAKDGKKEKIEKVEEVVEDESEVPKEPEPVFNENGEPIFIIVEIELHKPLIKKRDQEKVLESIYKIIPQREIPTQQQLETVNASKIYEDCIKKLIHNIHDEYQFKMSKILTAHYGHVLCFELSTANAHEIFYNVNETFKNSCKNFLMHLHVTGTYTKMTETMKEAVAAHVKETVGPEEMMHQGQDVLMGLYREMANKMYALVYSHPDPSMAKFEPEISRVDLQYFESEALEEGDYNKAHYYLLRRLEKSEKANPQEWIDFAAYWKIVLEFEKAEECAKEAISLDPRHTDALLFHGLLSWLLEDFGVAEMFLLAAVTFSPLCLEAWVILHMLHKQIGKQREARAELLNAKDCIKDFVPAIDKCNLSWFAIAPQEDRIFLVTAAKLLSLSFPEFAELALSYDLLLHGRTNAYLYYLAVCHYQQGRYANSLVHLEEALKMNWEDERLWALKGHSLYKLNKLEEAKEAYHVALNFHEEEDRHLINLRLGNILVKEGDQKGARDHYTVVCRDSPTPLSWMGLGIAAFVEDDTEAAELSLSEANMLDCKMGRVWGYLALVNLMLDRPAIFNKCIMHAFKYGFEDPVLMERIDSLVKMVQPITN